MLQYRAASAPKSSEGIKEPQILYWKSIVRDPTAMSTKVKGMLRCGSATCQGLDD